MKPTLKKKKKEKSTGSFIRILKSQMVLGIQNRTLKLRIFTCQLKDGSYYLIELTLWCLAC